MPAILRLRGQEYEVNAGTTVRDAMLQPGERITSPRTSVQGVQTAAHDEDFNAAESAHTLGRRIAVGPGRQIIAAPIHVDAGEAA